MGSLAARAGRLRGGHSGARGQLALPPARRGLAIVGLAGALAAAEAIRRRRPGRPAAVRIERVEPRGELGQVAVVVNPGSGSAEEDRSHLGGFRVRVLRRGEDLAEVARGLADEGAGVIGVVGGDGTVGCVAGIAAERDRVLWVLPGGTLNHFAAAIGMRDAEVALESLAAGLVARVDMGAAGEHPFVNNASLGVYGALVRRRERLERHVPKRIALLIAAVATLRGAEPLEIEVDGRPDRAWLVLVGNNPYEGIGLTGRASLQTGLLDVRVLRAPRGLPRLSVLAAILLGRLRRGDDWLRQNLLPEVRIRLREPTELAHDGEVREASGEVTFRSLPGHVRVVVAPPEG
jgi:diacylglycerol kinase family enzyme